MLTIRSTQIFSSPHTPLPTRNAYLGNVKGFPSRIFAPFTCTSTHSGFKITPAVGATLSTRITARGLCLNTEDHKLLVLNSHQILAPTKWSAKPHDHQQYFQTLSSVPLLTVQLAAFQYVNFQIWFLLSSLFSSHPLKITANQMK